LTATGSARLFLVRHAETEWNTAQIFQGHLDSDVTPKGLGQAALLAERLEAEGISAVYASDQGRALRTARVVASRLGLEVVPRPDLREIDCGEWTGKGYQEVRTHWPEEHATWMHQPQIHRMPGGESVAEVQRRGLRFLDEILSQHGGQSVCAVTHNTLVRAVVCGLMGWTLDQLWEVPRQRNCALNLIELRGSRLELLQIGDTSHLDNHQPPGRDKHPGNGLV
jgi:broad specificity phosphatase PhoE